MRPPPIEIILLDSAGGGRGAWISRAGGPEAKRVRRRATHLRELLAVAGAILTALFVTSPAAAAGPENWQVGFGEPGSAIARLVTELHDRVILIGAVIVLVVLGLLVYIAWRYRAARNPEASRTARAPVLEFAWTVLPIVIVGVIAVPSLAVLRYEAEIPPPELTVKVTGFQWFWRYEYPDHDGVAFDSLMLPAEELKPVSHGCSKSTAGSSCRPGG